MSIQKVPSKHRFLSQITKAATTCLLLAGSLAAQAAPADLSRLVVIGDSLMAGYQNGSLRGCQQLHGIAAVVAQQAGVPLALPLIGEPGIPNALALVDMGPPMVIAPLPGVSAGRTDLFTQPMNLSVPGHRVQDALSLRPGLPPGNLTDLILGFPGLLSGISRSQVEWAEALHPTTILVWLGPNDTLGAALEADASLVTPEAEFAAAYAELMQRLAATGASVVVANIPDVTTIPYLTSAEELAAALGLPLSVIGPVLGIGVGDYLTPQAFAQVQQILTGVAPGPLPGNVVLDAGEVATIQASTDTFNAIIAEQARLHGAALVDAHSVLNSWKAKGLVLNGQRLTTDFLGGLFSLDGFHPTDTAAAATANEFIHALNTSFAAGIPPVNVAEVARKDPLVLPAVGCPASALGVESKEAARGLAEALRH